MSQKPSFSAIILAAGAGKRLGYPKARLKVHGKWMLPHLLRVFLDGGCHRVYLVLPPEEMAACQSLAKTPGVFLIENSTPELGRTHSILCALPHIPEQDHLLIHPCDIPLLQAHLIRELCTTWGQQPKPSCLLARFQTPGGKGGHPLLVGRQHVEKLRQFAPDQPLRDLLHQAPITEILSIVLRGNPGPFLDVNTPEQLQLLESMLKPS